MNTFHRVSLVCLLSLFPHVTSMAGPAGSELVGTWYSEREDVDETLKWLTRRMQDNSYATLLLVCDGSALSWVQKETGHWQFEGGNLVQTMHTVEDMHGKKQAVDGADSIYQDLKLTGDALEYRVRDSGSLLRFIRVSDGHQISCQ